MRIFESKGRMNFIPDTKQEWLELRAKDITSTEVSALFDCSPYMTKYELWHRKLNAQVVEIEDNTRMSWGRALQDSIAEQFAKENNWTVRRMDEYVRNPELRMGSSFDFCVTDPAAILEIKNVDSLAFQQGWIVDGDNIEAPPHIELQVQHQLLVADMKVAYIGALIGGNRGILIRREASLPVQDGIKKTVSDFWRSIDAKEEPKPDFQRDAEFISRLYGHAEPGKVFNARGDESMKALVASYRVAADMEKLGKKNKDAAKAEILTKVGDAEKIEGDGYSVSMGLVGPCPVSYIREGYRNFRVGIKGEKK